jgi:hypothetical protein
MGFYLTPLLINPFEKVTIFLGTKSFEKQNLLLFCSGLQFHSDKNKS